MSASGATIAQIHRTNHPRWRTPGMSNLVSSDRAGTQRLYYDRPAGSWLEALPLGNGRIGAMVFGGVGAERIGLKDETLWSGSSDTARLLAAPLGATGSDAAEAVRAARRAGDTFPCPQ